MAEVLFEVPSAQMYGARGRASLDADWHPQKGSFADRETYTCYSVSKRHR
jgi:hypothetical protein